jgi:hypothetical protein
VPLTNQLSGYSSFEDFVSGLVQKTCEHFQWEFGAYWKCSPCSTEMSIDRIYYDKSLDNSDFVKDSQTRIFTNGEGMIGKVWRSGKVALSRNCAADMRLPRGLYAENVGLRNGVWMPVLGPRGIGVAEFVFSKPNIDLSQVTDDLAPAVQIAATFPMEVVE